MTSTHAPGRSGPRTVGEVALADGVLAWEPVIRAIGAQRPSHPPYAGHLYHAMTYGWLLGEVIRRVGGVMPGRYVQEALGKRLELHTWIGPPAEARASVAWVESPLPDEDSDAAREAARLGDASLTIALSLTMGGAFAFAAENGYGTFNDPLALGRALGA
jgi:CubicO group peptidase (beta-lactamase class C family)